MLIRCLFGLPLGATVFMRLCSQGNFLLEELERGPPARGSVLDSRLFRQILGAVDRSFQPLVRHECRQVSRVRTDKD